MAKLSTLSPSTTQRVLLYGPPKTGKTEIAGNLSSDFDLLWFDLEAGKDTLFKLPSEQQERINIISIPDTRGFPIAAETMLKVIKGLKVSICQEHGKVNCLACGKMGKPAEEVCLNELPQGTILVIDSLTQLSNSFIAHITKEQDEMYKMQTDDWGNLAKFVDMFLSYVQQLKCHVICITHDTTAELEDGKERVVPVMGSRNSSRNVAKYFDHVVYAQVTNGKHEFGSSTLYKNGITTGSRSGAVLEKAGKNPSLLDIMKGNVKQINPASPTPGTQAVNSLSALRNKLNASPQ
jgi:hypothetical protein